MTYYRVVKEFLIFITHFMSKKLHFCPWFLMFAVWLKLASPHTHTSKRVVPPPPPLPVMSLMIYRCRSKISKGVCMLQPIDCIFLVISIHIYLYVLPSGLTMCILSEISYHFFEMIYKEQIRTHRFKKQDPRRA